MNRSLYWLLISAGKGPEECAFAVYNVVALITAEAKQRSLTIETISIVKGKKPNLYYSTVLAVQGKQAANLVNHWQGTIQWICQSPFRKFCKRKNWFIAVNKLEPLEIKTPCSLQNKDIVFETFHASGPGGQHVNKTESAVRLLHKPTGTAIVAREWRSQYKNKQSALVRLADQLHIDYQASLAAATQERWLKQGELERGSPIITLVGPNFIKKC